jgi:hypothetical protein
LLQALLYQKRVTVGPDLLPGKPDTPGWEGSPVPGAFCWVDWPCVVLD